MCETKISGSKERSDSVVPRMDETDDQWRGSPAMLGLVLICSLAGWIVGIIVMVFVQDPSVMLILVAVLLGALATGAVVIGIRSFRGDA